MRTLRHTARYWAKAAEGGVTDMSTPFPTNDDSQDALESFLEVSKNAFGDKLRWVLLEQVDDDVKHYAKADWAEIKRLDAN